MNFILYSAIDEKRIGDQFGAADYSYFFLVKAFRRVLQQLGTVTIVEHPELEVDPLFEHYQQSGERCVFLSFSPPHKTLIDLKCPTVSVFAWEFSNVPNETWDDDNRNDWRVVFDRHGRTVTLSSYAARAVHEAMGAVYPVLTVPAPMWDGLAHLRGAPATEIGASTTLRLKATLMDSAVMGLSADGLIQHLSWPGKEVSAPVEPEPLPAVADIPPATILPKTWRYRLGASKRHFLIWYDDVVRDLMPDGLARILSQVNQGVSRLVYRVLGPGPRVPLPVVAEPVPVTEVAETSLTLRGIVYTSVFGATDGRKNWLDMVTAFVWAFRDVEDATLVLKFTQKDLSTYRDTLVRLLSELSPFKCRVVGLHAFLDDSAYQALIGATTFYVNASHCEGLCLPLMEFMCCGKPALAPAHTAMADYIDERAAFVVKAGIEHNVWPEDKRDLFRTLRYRIDWNSLMEGFRTSYRVAKDEAHRYEAMASAAQTRMREYCSDAEVTSRLRTFFQV